MRASLKLAAAGKKMCGSLKKSTSEQEELILEFFGEATKSLLDAKLLSQQQHDTSMTASRQRSTMRARISLQLSQKTSPQEVLQNQERNCK
jgi:hypothetical protein